jgi:hypothetical protein
MSRAMSRAISSVGQSAITRARGTAPGIGAIIMRLSARRGQASGVRLAFFLLFVFRRGFKRWELAFRAEWAAQVSSSTSSFKFNIACGSTSQVKSNQSSDLTSSERVT